MQDHEAGTQLKHVKTDVTIRVVYFDEVVQDPYTWSKWRKYKTVGIAVAYSMFTATNFTAYSQTYTTMLPALHTTELLATLANTVAFVAVAVGPTILSPVSEETGRKSMLLFTGLPFALLFIPQALSTNIAMTIVFRGLQGFASSGGNTLVAGVVADTFKAHDRAWPMSLYSCAIFLGQGIGAVMASWVDATLGFRWVNWVQLIAVGVILVLILFGVEETRGPALLQRKANRLTKETGILHVAKASQRSTIPLSAQIKEASSRSIVYLFTEPIIAAIALWVAVVWAILFLFFVSIRVVFQDEYGFSEGLQGTVFVSFIIGGVLGCLFCQWTDRFYQRDAERSPNGRAPPESRLYAACAGAIITPASIYWFAWSGQRSIPWIVPCLALVFFNVGVFPIYYASFAYLSDSYEMYASSAMSAQSLLRNILGGLLPLAGPTMYQNLGSKTAGTILASLCLLFAPLPMLLMRFGPRIRANSRVAAKIARKEEEEKLAVEKAQFRANRKVDV